MKKALLVSYYFPPLSGGASLRMWRCCKALQNDLDIEVLSIKHPEQYAISDETLLLPIKDLQIHRTRIIKFNKLWDLLSKLKINGRYLAPDPYIGWILPSLRKGLKILRGGRFDFILAVYPIATSLISGYLLSKISNLPLVVDFHDLFYEVIEKHLRTPWHKRFYFNLERRILKHASLICVVTAEVKKYTIQKHQIPAQKIMILPNNVDLGEFKIVKPQNKQEFVISYLGDLADYHLDGIYLLIEAINKAISVDPQLKIKFKIVGSNFPLKDPIAQKIKALDKNRIVELCGFVNKAEANSIMKRSDVLYVTLSPTSKYKLELMYTNPSKLLEYIACGKPVLAYLPQGSTQALIETHKIGYVTTSYDISFLAEKIKDLYNNTTNYATLSRNSLKLAKRFDSNLLYQDFLKRLDICL